jgi:hypothetical protein
MPREIVWKGLRFSLRVIPIRMVVGADQPCPRLLPGIARPEGLAAYSVDRRLDEALVQTQRAYDSESDR